MRYQNTALEICQVDISAMKTLAFLVPFLFGCTTIERPNADPDKYPEISIFLEDGYNFKSLHNMDNAIIKYEFYQDDRDAYFKLIDSVSAIEGWRKVSKRDSSFSRVYIKNINSYPADNQVDTVIIKERSDNFKLIWK